MTVYFKDCGWWNQFCLFYDFVSDLPIPGWDIRETILKETNCLLKDQKKILRNCSVSISPKINHALNVEISKILKASIIFFSKWHITGGGGGAQIPESHY